MKRLCFSLAAFSFLLVGCASRPNAFLPQKQANAYEEAINHFNYPDDVQLADCTARENINGAAPEAVHIKTLTQTFCKGWSFRLQDGKIWAKKDSEKDWSLFLKTGLPFSKAKTQLLGSDCFESPERISEIAADGDSLYAFDNRGRLYKVFTENATAEGRFNWVSGYGWPVKKQLVQNALVQNKRGWAMGTRRKDVLWYEDIFGHPHHYGTMGLETIYFLTEDGNELRFTDSGLPVDLAKTIQLPEDGAFIARNIACSASTLFLIGDDGTLYTRLIDFDTMGCDPMFFKYTYVEQEQKHDGRNYLSNYDPWGLPAEPWKAEPTIPLTGNARLSRFITIFQNGQGNASRELRVAGTNSDGQTGYYYKALNDKIWSFETCPLQIADEDFLQGDTTRAAKRLYQYEGFSTSRKKPSEQVHVSVRDFSLTHEGDCTLTVTMTGDGWEEAKTVHLYTVAMWSYTPKVNPGFDGTPKDFFMTVDAEKADLQAEHEALSACLAHLFGATCKKTFALTAQATDAYLQLQIPTSDGSTETLFLSKPNDTAPAQASEVLRSLPTDIYRRSALTTQTAAPLFNDSTLVLPERVYTASESDRTEIAACIARNRSYRDMLADEIAYYADLSRTSEKNRWRYRAADLITTITLLQQIDFPKIKTMASHGSTLIETNADTFKLVHESRALTSPAIISLVDIRIQSYEKLLQALESVAKSAHKEYAQKDSYPAYFAALTMPQVLTGVSKSAKKDAALYTLSDLPALAGFYLELAGEEAGKAIFVSLTDAAPLLYKKAQAGAATLSNEPIALPVQFYVLDAETAFISKTAGIPRLESRTGTLFWNGEELTIRVKHGLRSFTLFTTRT